MKAIRANERGKFILIKLREFYDKKRIIIKYVTSYLHEDKNLAKYRWRTIVIMKDSLLMANGLPNNFWAKAIETSNYLQNRLLIRSQCHRELVPKEAWTNQRQSFAYICIFDNLVFINIPHKKDPNPNSKRPERVTLLAITLTEQSISMSGPHRQYK